MADLLQVRDLKTYFYTSQGVVKAVDGVSYDIQEGETVALVGESGCGKTMSALSIMRLVPRPQGKIEDGEILFQGRNLLALDDEEMRKIRGAEIAMIFQEPMSSLNPVLTIGRQITETLEAHHPVSGEEARRRALDLLRLVGIPDPAQRFSDYPHQLSGGMRQRVMIAIAVSCGPKLILADEPTTALDVTIQAQILELLRGLSQEFGLAMIIITHNLGVVARYADRVHVMYAGKIIESASAREIYRNPRHPYTLGLLHSVPRLDQPRRAKLEPIEGQPPDLWDLPAGCSFAPRCKFVVERCAREAPPLRDLENHHRSACWVAENLKP
ncbi:MAG: ABC transporter ATP-binding protein [Deltaproteobacteria bacterium]|nr:ABC transporter ATP-binding protein [Deltaproteobacteria bacterium]